MLNNIARIQRALTQAHLDAILLTDENDRRFATGFPSSDGAVIVTVHQAFFITDARYIEAARREHAPEPRFDGLFSAFHHM